jgi:hypothetical protein
VVDEQWNLYEVALRGSCRCAAAEHEVMTYLEAWR